MAGTLLRTLRRWSLLSRSWSLRSWAARSAWSFCWRSRACRASSSVVSRTTYTMPRNCRLRLHSGAAIRLTAHRLPSGRCSRACRPLARTASARRVSGRGDRVSESASTRLSSSPMSRPCDCSSGLSSRCSAAGFMRRTRPSVSVTSTASPMERRVTSRCSSRSARSCWCSWAAASCRRIRTWLAASTASSAADTTAPAQRSCSRVRVWRSMYSCCCRTASPSRASSSTCMRARVACSGAAMA